MTRSIKDVARLAGFSTATVSHVLSGTQPVTEELTKRVIEAVEELNYQLLRVTRSLRKKPSSIIGLFISDIQNPFFTSLVRAVEDCAQQNDHSVFLCNSDEDVEKETMYVDLMLAERVAGVIMCPAHEVQNPGYKLVNAGIPLVSIDRRMQKLDVDTVLVVQQPTYELGLIAVEFLFKRIKDPNRLPKEVVLESKLLIRGSCGFH
jgi:LacI family transcriptional regulator